MSSAPRNPSNPNTEDHLSREEWWNLFDQLRLAQQQDYAEYGGPVDFVRKQRASDSNLD